MRLAPTVAVLLIAAAGCTGHVTLKTDMAAPRDLAVRPDLEVLVCDDANPCVEGARCYLNDCILDRGTCATDDDCQDDSFCEQVGLDAGVARRDGGSGDGGGDGGDEVDAGPPKTGICVPWGSKPRGTYDPQCKTPAVDAAALSAPVIKCSWTGPNSGALSTPIVADLDGDGLPEITFERFPDGFTSLHGKDCSVYFDETFAFSASNQGNLAVADLDGDHVPEIVGMDMNENVVVFDNHGTLIDTSPTPVAITYPFTGSQNWGGVAFADLDGDGTPEIIAGAQASHLVNKKIVVLWSHTALCPQFGPLSIVADVLPQAGPEVITGMQIFDAKGNDVTPTGLVAQRIEPGFPNPVGAYPAIGDFNKDGKPDLVLVQSVQGFERVMIFDVAHNKTIFGPFSLANEWGGPPTVADFDGDGMPDFATAGEHSYFVFSPKCLLTPKPSGCNQAVSNGELWHKTTHDTSSGSTGSSVFDFNGDGIAEVVYRDECWLRVYNGPDGKTLFAATVSSATALELPVVADVDNDGHADIVVTSDNFGMQCDGKPEVDTGTIWTGATTGLFVFSDPMNRWMPSRALWNQHSYHITNINDDLSVPSTEVNSWTETNTYRENVQGNNLMPRALGDATAQGTQELLSKQTDCANVWRLRADVCNRGTAPYAAGMPGTFYLTDPRLGGATPICTGLALSSVEPGACVEIACDWLMPAQDRVDLWFRVNDGGAAATPPATECKADNDTLYLPNSFCGSLE